MNGLQYTEDLARRAAELRIDHSLSEIAAILECSISSADRWSREGGWTPSKGWKQYRKGTLSKAVLEAALAESSSYAEAAHKLGVSPGSVLQSGRKYGLAPKISKFQNRKQRLVTTVQGLSKRLKRPPTRQEVIKELWPKSGQGHFDVEVRYTFGDYESLEAASGVTLNLAGTRKLTLKQANQIRADKAAGRTWSALQKKYKVSSSSLSKILKNETYRS